MYIIILCELALYFGIIVSVSFSCHTFTSLLLLVLYVLNIPISTHSSNLSIAKQTVMLAVCFVWAVLFIPFALTPNMNAVERADTWYDRELYSRFATYEIADTQGERSATFSGVLLTAKDLLPLGEKEIYTVNDTLTNDAKMTNDILIFIQDDVLKGRVDIIKPINDINSLILKHIYKIDPTVKTKIKVTAVGPGAFRDATAIKTVVLPESIASIEAGAFDGSAVRIVEVYAPEIHIKGSLEGSTVTAIVLHSPYATKIVVEDISALPENITFCVPEELVWDCRSINPEIADYIIAFE